MGPRAVNSRALYWRRRSNFFKKRQLRAKHRSVQMLSPAAPASNPPGPEGLSGHQGGGCVEYDGIDTASINCINNDEPLWYQARTNGIGTLNCDGDSLSKRSGPDEWKGRLHGSVSVAESDVRAIAEPLRKAGRNAHHIFYRRNRANLISIGGEECGRSPSGVCRTSDDNRTDRNEQLTKSCLGWLRLAFFSEYAEVILKKPKESFISISRPWRLSAIAHAVANSENIIGVRPEKSIRAIIIDIDNKERAASPYWQENGKSKELVALQQHAEDCGCQLTMLQSSESRGLHAVLSLPEATPAWLGHWIGQELLRRSGMRPGAGRAEVFPSEIPYVRGEQKDWMKSKGRSNGVRLPGQKGCKLITNRGMIENGEMIYRQLICDLDNTENSPEWQILLDSSRQLARQVKKEANRAKKECVGKDNTSIKPAGKPASNIRWGKCGESAEVLARIATWARIKHSRVKCEYQLAEIIRNYAVRAEGYEQYASDKSKKDIENREGGWALRWARSSLRRAWANKNGGEVGRNAEGRVGGDKHHNDRLYKQSRAKLTYIWKQFRDVSGWSKRRVAKEAGLNRATLEKHWDYWVQLVAHTQSYNGGCRQQAPLGGPGQLDSDQLSRGAADSAPMKSTSRATYTFTEEYIYIEDFEYIPIRMLRKPETLLMCRNNTC